MALRLASHLSALAAAGFVGFFSGGAAFMLLFSSKPQLPFYLIPFLFFGLILGGTYLVPVAFAFFFPAVCPACRAASAVPTLREPTVYVCRACGVASDAMHAMLLRQLASMQTGSVERGEAFLAWVFVLVGLACMGGSVGGMQDSIALLQHGTATEGRVLRITQQPSRSSKGNPETRYTAVIQYHVGAVPHTLTRSWSVLAGGGCGWPCYIEGQPLEVIYTPGDPGRAKVHSPPELFGPSGMIAAGGLLFAVIGVLVLRHARRNPPRPPRESWKEMRDLFAAQKLAQQKEPGPSTARARTGRGDE